MIDPSIQTTEVTVAQIEAYLQQKQWYVDGDIRKIATIWHRRQDEDAEVVLPQPTARDFHQRLKGALTTIASYEKREVSDLLRDIKRLFANFITVRVIHADTKDGTIPISDGVLLVTKAKDLLSAAAQSVFVKRKHYTGSTPREAKDYLETLRLGQTEVGSYVVNVIAPLQESSMDGPATAEAIPLAQAITLNLVTGLEALTKANEIYEEQGDLRVFDDAVLSGASANMCDALLGFSGAQNNREFEVTVTAAASPLFDSEPRKFAFGAPQVAVLQKASGYYKDDYVLPQRQLLGYITKLSRPKDETSGTITVDAEVNGVERKVKVALMGEDYHMAVLAHYDGKVVRVDGDVRVKAKAAELLNPSNFGVITMDKLL